MQAEAEAQKDMDVEEKKTLSGMFYSSSFPVPFNRKSLKRSKKWRLMLG